MAFSIRISTPAQFDIWDAISWYENQQPGLGEKFNHQLYQLLTKIAENPLLYSFYKDNFRKAILKPFPYILLFKLNENEIIVYTVIYGGRNPTLINKRTI